MGAVVRAYQSLRGWLSEQLFMHKLDSPLGYVLLGLMGIFMAYFTTHMPLNFGFALLAVIIGVPIVILCVANAMLGIGLILVVSVFMGLPAKYVNLPLGTSLDFMLFLLFFGLLIKQVKERDFGFAKSPISIFIIIWVGYNLFQVLNPWTESRMAWLFTVRSMGGLIMLYFVACYALTSIKHVTNLLKLVLGLGLLSALYGLKQEYIGFSDQELAWLYSDAHRLELIFQWSRLRIFSFFSDPTNYGIYMAYLGSFSLILATGPLKRWQKIVLVITALLMFLAMAYAGSRTPFVLLPAGLVFFVLMTLKKQHIIGLVIFFSLGTLFVLKSTSNAVLFRIQSAFDISKSDDTVQVRMNSQKYIQPLIQSHPFGVGLGATGVWGQRFTPNSKLASFAHDSGFVRIAVELGWIGLLIFTALLFTIIRTSVYYYIRVKDPLIKTLYLGLSVIVFQLTLASYPQEAIVVLPTSITFYVIVAMIVKMKDFDQGAFAPYSLNNNNSVDSPKGPAPLKDRSFLRHKS